MSEAVRRNVRITVQHYKSLLAAVMTCATMVNTHTDTQTVFDRLRQACYKKN